jgi:Tol biopolymer transport system component
MTRRPITDSFPRRRLGVLTVPAVLLAVLLATVGGQIAPAEATRPSPPVLSAQKAVSGQLMTMTGATGRNNKVVLQHRVRGRWQSIAKTKAGNTGLFTIKARATLGRQSYRALSRGLASNVVTTNPKPHVTVDKADRYVITGALPTSTKRPLVLQRRAGAKWATITKTTTRRTFHFVWKPATTTVVRVLAPRHVRVVGKKKHRHRIVDPQVASVPIELGPVQPRIRLVDLRPFSKFDSDRSRISADGKWVAFCTDERLTHADTNDRWDVYLQEVATGATTLASRNRTTGLAVGFPADAYGMRPAVSANGRYVAFSSDKDAITNAPLAAGIALYRYDNLSGDTELVSKAVGGAANNFSVEPSMSADGRFVAFSSAASNLAGIDTNNLVDVYVRDMSLSTATTRLVSHAYSDPIGAADKTSSAPSISADGTRIAYQSEAKNIGPTTPTGQFNIYVWNAETGTNRLISASPTSGSPANGRSFRPAISADGSAIAFESDATNLGLTSPNFSSQVFLYRTTGGPNGSITPISTPDGTTGGEALSLLPAVNADGSRVAFLTAAQSLAPDLAAGHAGIVLWASGVLHLIASPAGNPEPTYATGIPSLDDTGKRLTFDSTATGLDPGRNVLGDQHVFLATIP